MYKIYISKLPRHTWVLEEFNSYHLYWHWSYWLCEPDFWRLVSVQSCSEVSLLQSLINQCLTKDIKALLTARTRFESPLCLVEISLLRWYIFIYIDLSIIKTWQKFSRAVKICAVPQDGKITLKQKLIGYQTLHLL